MDMTSADKLGMLSPHSWAPVPGTLIYPGLKNTQMFAAFPGLREGMGELRMQSCHRLREA